jgi:hypothetical protein
MRIHRHAAPFALVVAVAACSSQALEPVQLHKVELGSAVDAQERISAPTRTFAPGDTVYVSIATEGGGPATLTVQWYAKTSMVQTETKTIAPKGPASFAFHFAPPGGWPTGTSRVIFYLSADDKHGAEFDVQ